MALTAGVVNDRHTRPVPGLLDHVSLQVIADVVGVPAGPAQQVLQPCGRVVTGMFSQPAAVLPAHRTRTAPSRDPAVVEPSPNRLTWPEGLSGRRLQMAQSTPGQKALTHFKLVRLWPLPPASRGV
ncbi:hypothetical protein [Streptomyces sp. MUSC 14]|uniref:hypothetical protein n=1 Tax=Streptomyces sp. MUSC 14 TaxID=1354889 RepID=UPI0015A54651